MLCSNCVYEQFFKKFHIKNYRNVENNKIEHPVLFGNIIRQLRLHPESCKCQHNE